MTDRTPTPWELIEATEHHGAYVVNSWGCTVCDLYAMSNPMAASVRNGGTSFPVPFDDMAANAAIIVKAVNSHDALVKALEFIRDGYDNHDVNHVDYRVKVYQVALDALSSIGVGRSNIPGEGA